MLEGHLWVWLLAGLEGGISQEKIQSFYFWWLPGWEFLLRAGVWCGPGPVLPPQPTTFASPEPGVAAPVMKEGGKLSAPVL